MAQLTDNHLEQLRINIPKKVGNRIRFLRKEKGLTQTKLAELVGKDRQYLYKIEKGKVTPNVVTISSLASALEISLKDFFDFETK